MKVLLTRPWEDSQRFAERLARCGIESLITPLMVVEPVAHPPIDGGAFQAILLTSANGARALASATPCRSVRILAVGAATAAEAQSVGFSVVEQAGGDVEKLAALAAARLDPAAGKLLHVAGSVTAGDLLGLLEASGFLAERQVLYRAVPAQTLPEDAEKAILGGELVAAAFFSPRTASTFAKLVTKAGCRQGTVSLVAYCLSQAVADAFDGLDWQEIYVPHHPEGEALAHLICSSMETS